MVKRLASSRKRASWRRATHLRHARDSSDCAFALRLSRYFVVRVFPSDVNGQLEGILSHKRSCLLRRNVTKKNLGPMLWRLILTLLSLAHPASLVRACAH
jgi:hypothetical protein